MKFKKKFNNNKNKPQKHPGNINRIDAEIQQLKDKYAELSDEGAVLNIQRFTDFPLSEKTLKGLIDAKYATPTAIQRASIIPALKGRDVLGAAITGSGKTLAFLIPILENLFMNKYSRMDGVAAIIISPTRELAYQIFETLKKIGKYHDFSAGLIIGGKNLKFERTRMDQCNIMICTPGRLLQHMDENPLFNASSMQILVLDEADRCLDMGFEQTLNAIIENLPTEKQTLLFSATQTNSVRDLARLKLANPVYINPKESTKTATDPSKSNLAVPELLKQHYVVMALEDKITMLWSFIKNHLKQKTIVFLSSCKQVKYIFEIFCKLRPGISLLALYGTLHQDRRIAIYNDFLNKNHVVMFATDIASRGLDFPCVNWVVQLDCPEDVKQYVHRAGRSARNKKSGESLLVLLPSEEKGMIAELEKEQISIPQIHIDPKKLFSPRIKMEAYLAQHSELKESAQRAFVAYIKSVFLMKNKQIFDVRQLNFDAYARSLGLAITPRVRFLERYQKQKIQKDERRPEAQQLEMKALQSDSDEEEDDFLQLKRADHDIQGEDAAMANDDSDLPLPVPRQKKEKVVTKAALAKRALKKKILINEKRLFDDEGAEILDARKEMQSDLAKQALQEMDDKKEGGINLEIAKKVMNEEDKYDKQRFRELVKQRHKNLKAKLKNRESDDNDEEDDFDESSEGENSVDLSWLPDPSKVYSDKNKNHDDDDDEQNNESSDEESLSSQNEDEDEIEEEEPVHKKAKVTSKLSLDDAELIAAQLLAQSQ